jgi:uncharacterized membrane protein YhaH (DUF805 family)
MTITASCQCGKTFRVPEKFAGKRIKCSSCGEPLSVPAASPSTSSTAATATAATSAPATAAPATAAVTFSCQCGAKFRVTPALSGKRVRCPKCQTPVQLPDLAGGAPATAALPTPAPTPVVDDGFWDDLHTAPGTGVPNPFADSQPDGGALRPNLVGDLAANEVKAYAIKLFHQGKNEDEVYEALVQQGLSPSEADRLVEILSPKKNTGIDENSIGYLLFNFDGAIPRSKYWLGMIIAFVLVVIIGAIVAAVAIGMQIDFEDLQTLMIIFGVASVFWFLVMYMQVAVMLKRLHDLEMDGWWLVYTIIPFVGPFISIYLWIKMGFIRGNL